MLGLLTWLATKMKVMGNSTMITFCQFSSD